jgi:hypothetical protein
LRGAGAIGRRRLPPPRRRACRGSARREHSPKQIQGSAAVAAGAGRSGHVVDSPLPTNDQSALLTPEAQVAAARAVLLVVVNVTQHLVPTFRAKSINAPSRPIAATRSRTVSLRRNIAPRL